MSNQDTKFFTMILLAAGSATIGSVCFTVFFSSLAIAVQLQLPKRG